LRGRFGARPALLLSLLSVLALVLPAFGAGLSWLTLPGGEAVRAEVMVSAAERHHGLTGRASLPEDRLMLFAYPEDGVHHVWMKGCRFAIDVAWLDAAGTVLAVEENLPPCPRDPCPVYGPEIDSRYFVEGAAGWLEARGVAVGTRIRVGPIEALP
jgi:uncharacterized membrane protein (UPF0127 family)